MAAELLANDFVVVNMNKRSKTFPFDLLVNGKIRIDVKSAKLHKGTWRFTLSNKAQLGLIESDRYIRLNNGRIRKKFAEDCDFVILCGIWETDASLFILPAKEICDIQQTIAVNPIGRGKWWEWHNRFDLIRETLKAR